jgi:site-specific recombinase XerD
MSSASASGRTETDRLVDGFAGYLRRERGVSTFTVDLYAADVRRFLAGRGIRELSELTPADVSHAVLDQVGTWSPASVRRFGCALRWFLRYCFLTGLVERGASGAALPVSGRRRSLLPQGITPAQEKALLRACDRRRSTGRRDYAVILLILRLGLRANEVATLRLDDLDWRAGSSPCTARATAPTSCRSRWMSARRSPHSAAAAPRSATTRRCSCVQPPLAGLTRVGVSSLVAAAARRRAWRGAPRRLRHTAATDMLRAGASLPEVGQVLRHRSVGSTAIYAGRCRAAAPSRPWPSAATS